MFLNTAFFSISGLIIYIVSILLRKTEHYFSNPKKYIAVVVLVTTFVQYIYAIMFANIVTHHINIELPQHFTQIALFGLYSYVIGSIPFALLITKVFTSQDIREFGSGNVGTTNAMRCGGKKSAFLTLALDFSKSFIPLLLFKQIFHEKDSMLLLIGLLIILGHIFPIWIKFKGGKGVATALGLYFAHNFYLGLIAVFTWVTVMSIFKYSSLASISMVTFVTIFSFTAYRDDANVTAMFLVISIIISFMHYQNIVRLIKGKENKVF